MARILRCDDYTVGWVCALPVELAAAQEMLDEEHPDLERDPADNDENLYALGSIGGHNVAIGCLPAGRIGNNPAAAVATQMRATFKKMRFGLMVGIGGGVPSAEADVRLGDVVVSQPQGKHGGVVQYDLGKATPSGFERTGALNSPPQVLLAAVARVRANELRGRSKLCEHITKLEGIGKFQRSKAGPDVLFEAAYKHEGGQTCDRCNPNRHEARESRDNEEEVATHYGTIASGDQVIKDAAVRDKLSAELGGVLCFEMEAAGLMNSFPCLVVRGVCDYADSHKSKRWQAYAAGTAAAYAKEVLSVIPPAEMAEARTVEETTRTGCKRAPERSTSPCSKRRRVDATLVSRSHGKQTTEVKTKLPLEEQECLRSLAFSEQEHRLDDIHTAVDTCDWLFEDPKYQAWIEETTGLFWIKGDPGAGKSVLMKHSVKRMRERSSNDLVVSFFFHGQGTPLQKTLLGLYRALLTSMLQNFPEHLTRLVTKFSEREKRYGRFSERRWEWTEKELQVFLSDTLVKGTHCQPVIIFVDALDECGEDAAKGLLAYFKDLMSQAEGGHARFRICLSSRHYPILGLDTIPSVHVEERNNQDIRRYIKRELRDIRPKSKRKQIEIEILSKSNGGFQWAFLVTKTIADKNLTGIKAEKLLEELVSCPQTLGEVYEAILDSVPATDQHQMAKIFQWVRFAERPLSAQELRDALAADQDMSHRTIFELRAYEGWSDSLADFARHVKHISRGLIRFQSRELWEQYDPNDEDSDCEAQLIHQSVADFLMDQFVNSARGHGPIFQSSAGPSHFQISRSCLRYMTLEGILEDAHLSRGTLSSRYPLAPYAVRFLFAHIQKVEQEGIPQPDLLSAMRWLPESETVRKIGTLWRTLDPDSIHTPLGWPFIGATSLHVLVAFRSMSAIETLFDSDCDDIGSRDADGNTPLMLAIREGHQEIALALLGRFIECEDPHKQHDNSGERRAKELSMTQIAVINAQNQDGDTALDIALDQRMGEVILNLVEAGADLKFMGRETALVAHAISSRNIPLLSILIEKKLNLDGAVFFALKGQPPQRDLVLERIVFQLLGAGANTARSLELNDVPQPEDYEEDDEEEEDRYDSDALALASRNGLADIVEMLLSLDAPATSQNDFGECPLLIAVLNGHENIVKKLLLRAPSSVELADHLGSTALSIAKEDGREDITKLLLQEGSFSASNTLLEECFLYAILDGATDVVGIMLQRKLVNLEGKTHLWSAIQNGHEAVVKLLLDTNKFDINATTSSGSTPLLLAIEKNYEPIVKLLLDTSKIDVNAQDNSGNTPLCLAAQNGHEVVVKLLLDTNKVDVNKKGEYGWTPLLLATHYCHEPVVKLLLNTNTVDVNTKTSEYWTPLLLAANDGYTTLIKLLLDTNKVDVNAKTKDGWTPLFFIAAKGYTDALRLLLDADGVDADHCGPYRRTPLWWAVRNRREAVVKLLLDIDVIDVNAKDINGSTPLLWAVKDNCQDIVTLLIATGKVDLSIEDEDGCLPLVWAKQNNQSSMVELLQTHRNAARARHDSRSRRTGEEGGRSAGSRGGSEN